MNAAAIDRVLQRLVILRNGTATAAGDLAWDVTFPEDVEQAEGATLAFRIRVTLDGERASAVEHDAPLDRGTPARAAAVAAIQAELAAALAREAIRVPSAEALTEYLVAETGGELDEGTVEIPAGDVDGEPVFAAIVPVAREPWVNLSIAFDDGADPDWLLEQSGYLTHVHFEAFEGSVSLACAFPLALLTAQRLLELVDDLVTFREQLLDELDGGDGEGEEGDEG